MWPACLLAGKKETRENDEIQDPGQRGHHWGQAVPRGIGGDCADDEKEERVAERRDPRAIARRSAERGQGDLGAERARPGERGRRGLGLTASRPGESA